MNFFRWLTAEMEMRDRDRGQGSELVSCAKQIEKGAHEYGYYPTGSVNASASRGWRGAEPFLSMQTPPSSKTFEHYAKLWMLRSSPQ